MREPPFEEAGAAFAPKLTAVSHLAASTHIVSAALLIPANYDYRVTKETEKLKRSSFDEIYAPFDVTKKNIAI